MNPTSTGGVAITTAALGSLIVWACGVIRIEAPPMEVAGTMAAVLMYTAHGAVVAFKSYFPPKAAPAAPAQ